MAKTLVSKTKEKLLMIQEQVKNDTFEYNDFSFEKKRNSGLTEIVGIYMIINKRTKKMYLGGSGDLAQRKGEHRQNFTKVTRYHKVYNSMKQDLTKGKPDDFYFVPIVGFHQDLATLSNNAIFTGNSKKKQFSIFIDIKVEQVILNEMLANESLSEVFYNQKSIGAFQTENPYGGTPQSGMKNRALYFENNAWESVSASAKSLKKDRKSIRKKRDNKVLIEMSLEEYQNFKGIKISNTEASNFFDNDKNALKTLKKKIGFQL